MNLLDAIKNLLRPIVKLSPIPLTKGQRIDVLSSKIIKLVCQPTSNCIDVGAHKGEILDIMRKAAPQGQFFAFEPLPHFYAGLVDKYQVPNVKIFNCALGNVTETTTFHHVVTNPAYSGLKKRRYDRPSEQVEEIRVEVKKMDDCIPASVPVDFIKIDVEGAELMTLLGAQRLLSIYHPTLLFEHGIGGADSYGYGPKELWTYLTSMNYQIFTLHNFLAERNPLTLTEIELHFENGDEFYFVAK